MNTKPRLLVVEDDPGTRVLLVEMLRVLGYEPLAAQDGLAGLELARRERPDLVVTDLAMPRMTGWDLARALRAERERALADVPIVALSACVLDGHQESALGAGCNRFLSKPVSLNDFQETIQTLLRERARPLQVVEQGWVRPGAFVSTAGKP